MITLAQLFLTMPYAVGIAVIFFGLGMLVKRVIIAKLRKRMLSLEDEMLANHSRILSLEKKLAETQLEENGVVHDYDLRSARQPDAGRKVS